MALPDRATARRYADRRLCDPLPRQVLMIVSNNRLSKLQRQCAFEPALTGLRRVLDPWVATELRTRCQLALRVEPGCAGNYQTFQAVQV